MQPARPSPIQKANLLSRAEPGKLGRPQTWGRSHNHGGQQNMKMLKAMFVIAISMSADRHPGGRTCNG